MSLKHEVVLLLHTYTSKPGISYVQYERTLLSGFNDVT